MTTYPTSFLITLYQTESCTRWFLCHSRVWIIISNVLHLERV
ncbi:hypothetical protein HanPSC8_Chr15g0655261 [Helianthus annuus]|nr:hypothetical protein HanPSC8_Chr15g0655261 [Helianthus annuus]